MSSLKIEERFSVQAPVERIWRFLLDPEQIAPCLPGAELLQIENERTFHGQMKVKVGPVTVAYQGTIELTHVDEAGRRVQMVGKGKEKGGAGSAKMTMESHLEPQPDGTVAIAVVSDVELAGRIVRFGRGMIQSVSAQLFKQFAANVRQVLEGGGAGDAAGDGVAASASGAATEAGAELAVPAASAQALPESDAGDAAREREPATAEAAPAPQTGAHESDLPATPAAEAAAPGDGADQAALVPEPSAPPGRAALSTPATAPAATPSAAQVSEPAAPRAAQAPQARTGRELAPRTAEPVRALPLLFRALWDVITGFFKRLLGRSR
jgi:carbon monoxide dehydrogenase subunit G